MAYVDDAELKDLRKWKEIGMDAVIYKDGVVKSIAWNGDMAQDGHRITAVLNDLQQFKRDNAQAASPEPATELKPGLYRVK